MTAPSVWEKRLVAQKNYAPYEKRHEIDDCHCYPIHQVPLIGRVTRKEVFLLPE